MASRSDDGGVMRFGVPNAKLHCNVIFTRKCVENNIAM